MSSMLRTVKLYPGRKVFLTIFLSVFLLLTIANDVFPLSTTSFHLLLLFYFAKFSFSQDSITADLRGFITGNYADWDCLCACGYESRRCRVFSFHLQRFVLLF